MSEQTKELYFISLVNPGYDAENPNKLEIRGTHVDEWLPLMKDICQFRDYDYTVLNEQGYGTQIPGQPTAIIISTERLGIKILGLSTLKQTFIDLGFNIVCLSRDLNTIKKRF